MLVFSCYDIRVCSFNYIANRSASVCVCIAVSVHAKMSFKNKVVIVTGASSGIGAATALKFSKEGAAVVMVARDEAKLKAVKKKCDAEGWPAFIVMADISEEDEAKSVIEKTVNEFGKIDILINNAGILRCGRIVDGSILETYDEIMNTNIRAVVYLTTYATPYLTNSSGNIVNISTIGGERVICSEYNAYCVSKAALTHFTRAAAMELGEYGVRVNTVSPGIVRTDLLKNAGFNTDDDDNFVFKTVMNKWTEPEEIADLILYVASDKAKSITGSNFVSDNGNLLI
ncbi:3-oxoacyl-[acyl-carrier-protein] reductase FabG-like [Pieris brassicae]|uniref:3-oxoacyl-[acyl-carrier-protein] reductase FabG-like n=1 Tax=Pieris brassicae TaxID=7116 RepID=UPI001E65ECF2|nr:3-oxoacyl-[acyl-carrier-protein] reductase FabG-like [Pieris brassicae]